MDIPPGEWNLLFVGNIGDSTQSNIRLDFVNVVNMNCSEWYAPRKSRITVSVCKILQILTSIVKL